MDLDEVCLPATCHLVRSRQTPHRPQAYGTCMQALDDDSDDMPEPPKQVKKAQRAAGRLASKSDSTEDDDAPQCAFPISSGIYGKEQWLCCSIYGQQSLERRMQLFFQFPTGAVMPMSPCRDPAKAEMARYEADLRDAQAETREAASRLKCALLC